MITLFFLQVSYKYAKTSNTNRNIITTTTATATATTMAFSYFYGYGYFYITIISIYYVGSFELDVRSNQVANRDQPLFFPKKSNIKINYWLIRNGKLILLCALVILHVKFVS